MILHNYKTSAGKDLIFEYIDGLTEDEKVDKKIVQVGNEIHVYEVFARK